MSTYLANVCHTCVVHYPSTLGLLYAEYRTWPINLTLRNTFSDLMSSKKALAEIRYILKSKRKSAGTWEHQCFLAGDTRRINTTQMNLSRLILGEKNRSMSPNEDILAIGAHGNACNLRIPTWRNMDRFYAWHLAAVRSQWISYWDCTSLPARAPLQAIVASRSMIIRSQFSTAVRWGDHNDCVCHKSIQAATVASVKTLGQKSCATRRRMAIPATTELLGIEPFKRS